MAKLLGNVSLATFIAKVAVNKLMQPIQLYVL
jgi:hypothetical protein